MKKLKYSPMLAVLVGALQGYLAAMLWYGAVLLLMYLHPARDEVEFPIYLFVSGALTCAFTAFRIHRKLHETKS